MRNIFICLIVGLLFGCAGKVPRTRWTDPVMRIMIDPDSIEPRHYVRIQQALVASKKWVVVDRASGFRAIRKEQELLHRQEPDRFADREKFALWKRLYGIRGVVVASAQCTRKHGWLVGNAYEVCLEYLSLIDANTGVVVSAVEVEAEGDLSDAPLIAPSWQNAVEELNNAFPSHFESNKDSKQLNDYRELAGEEAVRQKEERAKEIMERK